MKTYTIGELLQIDPGRVHRSKELNNVTLVDTYNIVKPKNVFQKILKFLGIKTANMFYVVFKYRVMSNSGNQYTVFIKVSPSFDKQKFMDNKVEVFCSCPDFKYRAAYYLNKRDNLYLNDATKSHLGKLPLTEEPTKVDPTNICKHIFAVLGDFQRQIPHLIISK